MRFSMLLGVRLRAIPWAYFHLLAYRIALMRLSMPLGVRLRAIHGCITLRRSAVMWPIAHTNMRRRYVTMWMIMRMIDVI